MYILAHLFGIGYLKFMDEYFFYLIFFFQQIIQYVGKNFNKKNKTNKT